MGKGAFLSTPHQEMMKPEARAAATDCSSFVGWTPKPGWKGPAPPDCMFCMLLTQVPGSRGWWEQPKLRVADSVPQSRKAPVCLPESLLPGAGRIAEPLPCPRLGSGLGAPLNSFCICHPPPHALLPPASSGERLVKFPFLFSWSFMVFQKTG